MQYKQVKSYQAINNLSFVDSYKALKYKLTRDQYFRSKNYAGPDEIFDLTYKDVIFQVKITVDYDDYHEIDYDNCFGELVNETTNKYAIKSRYGDQYYIPYGLDESASYYYTYKTANDLKKAFSKLGYSKHDSYLKTLNSFKNEYQNYLERDKYCNYSVDIQVYLKEIEINFECLGFISCDYEVYNDHLNLIYDHGLIETALENSYKKLKDLSSVILA
ncbi:MAG: hypothetical protein RLZZ171_1199 [Cyanobacteriota bacterium]|jgi:hypothetical protein